MLKIKFASNKVGQPHTVFHVGFVQRDTYVLILIVRFPFWHCPSTTCVCRRGHSLVSQRFQMITPFAHRAFVWPIVSQCLLDLFLTCFLIDTNEITHQNQVVLGNQQSELATLFSSVTQWKRCTTLCRLICHPRYGNKPYFYTCFGWYHGQVVPRPEASMLLSTDTVWERDDEGFHMDFAAPQV